MVCQRGGFITQHHNELSDLEAEMLRTVCDDVEVPRVGPSGGQWGDIKS